ncbi:hypothetical protein SH528x_003797 [Novipirellula sp. SH528]|uniref:hypothetical protein n=1 Tax=Novipirellula sp. SH528 TaxID=3454466 RepID=UPI003FA156BD
MSPNNINKPPAIEYRKFKSAVWMIHGVGLNFGHSRRIESHTQTMQRDEMEYNRRSPFAVMYLLGMLADESIA